MKTLTKALFCSLALMSGAAALTAASSPAVARGEGRYDGRCGDFKFRTSHEDYCYGAGGTAYAQPGAHDAACGGVTYRAQHPKWCNGAAGVTYRHPVRQTPQ